MIRPLNPHPPHRPVVEDVPRTGHTPGPVMHTMAA